MLNFTKYYIFLLIFTLIGGYIPLEKYFIAIDSFTKILTPFLFIENLKKNKFTKIFCTEDTDNFLRLKYQEL